MAALEHQAAKRPDAAALVFPAQEARMTFAQWRDDAGALARALMELGAGPGTRVALLAENRAEWPVVQLAVAAAGAVLVPLNTHYRRDDLRYALEQSRSRVLLASRAFRSNPYLDTVAALRPALPALRQVISLDGPQEDCLDYSTLVAKGRASSAALPAVTPDDIGSLQYTSGTTGHPKGALLTHSGMLVDAWGSARRLRVTPADRWTSIIPLFHCVGCIMSLLGCLQTGACYVGVAGFDAEQMFRVIEAERCTLLSGVPTTYLAMADHPARERHDLSSLRAGTCGGADCDPQVLARCAEMLPIAGLCQVYGQTEVCTLVACPEPDDPERFATAGRPLPGLRVRIADTRDGRTLSPGSIGEIVVRGATVMRGYHERDAETAEVLSPDGWLRTGDLGYLTPEGRLVIAGGRLRDMIIRGGENVYPAEIENVLVTHPAVTEAAVFGEPDDYYGERVAAAVRLECEARAADLVAYCKERLAGFKVPATFYRVDTLPFTASGKVRKTVLRERARDGAMERLP